MIRGSVRIQLFSPDQATTAEPSSKRCGTFQGYDRGRQPLRLEIRDSPLTARRATAIMRALREARRLFSWADPFLFSRVGLPRAEIHAPRHLCVGRLPATFLVRFDHGGISRSAKPRQFQGVAIARLPFSTTLKATGISFSGFSVFMNDCPPYGLIVS
jgi:hypothetical protein